MSSAPKAKPATAAAAAPRRAPAAKARGAAPPDIEGDLRAGIRRTLLDKIRASVLEHRVRAGVQADWKPGPDEVALAAAFEEALHDQALRAWRACPRREAFRVVYVQIAAADALRALEAPCGPYPDETLAVRLFLGEVSPVAAAADDVLHALQAETPKQVCVRLLLGALLKNPVLATDRPRALAMAAAVEASCYRAVIRQCKETESPFRRCWESEQFVAQYSGRVGTVFAHIDPDGSVCRAYGSDLLSRLLAGTTDPKDVGSLSAAQLCPEATENEKSEIALRSQQKVETKHSELFTCPVKGCGARKTTYREVHTRSLDEPSDVHIQCSLCGWKWRIRG